MAHNVATNGSPRFTQNTDVVLVSHNHICKIYITFFADTSTKFNYKVSFTYYVASFLRILTPLNGQ